MKTLSFSFIPVMLRHRCLSVTTLAAKEQPMIVCLVDQTHKTVTAITGGTVSVTTSAEALGMLAADRNMRGRSATLETSLKRLLNALVSSNTTFAMLRNTGVASVKAEDCGLISITAGGSDGVAIL